MLYGWIEVGMSNTDLFAAESNEDIILRTIYNNKIIIGNTSGTGTNAGLYITDNCVGVKKVPDPLVSLDVNGFVVLRSAQVGLHDTPTILTVNGDLVIKDQVQGLASNMQCVVKNSNSVVTISYNGTQRASISDGQGISLHDSVYIAGDTFATAFHLTSDERSKINISHSDAMVDIEILRRLKVADYELRARAGKVVKGFIAQQVENVFPEAVETSQATGYKTLDPNQIIALNTSVLQNILSRLEALEKICIQK